MQLSENVCQNGSIDCWSRCSQALSTLSEYTNHQGQKRTSLTHLQRRFCQGCWAIGQVCSIRLPPPLSGVKKNRFPGAIVFGRDLVVCMHTKELVEEDQEYLVSSSYRAYAATPTLSQVHLHLLVLLQLRSTVVQQRSSKSGWSLPVFPLCSSLSIRWCLESLWASGPVVKCLGNSTPHHSLLPVSQTNKKSQEMERSPPGVPVSIPFPSNLGALSQKVIVFQASDKASCIQHKSICHCRKTSHH